MVEDRELEYFNSKRLNKPFISLEIVRLWRAQSPPGRFLKQNEETGLWDDVGDKKAKEKTSQALREKAPAIRKQRRESIQNGEKTSEGPGADAAPTCNGDGERKRSCPTDHSKVGMAEQMIDHPQTTFSQSSSNVIGDALDQLSKRRRSMEMNEHSSANAKSEPSTETTSVAKSSDFTAYPQIRKEIEEVNSLKSYNDKITHLKKMIIEAVVEENFVRAGELSYFTRSLEIQTATATGMNSVPPSNTTSSNAMPSAGGDGQKQQQMFSGPPNLTHTQFGGLNQIQSQPIMQGMPWSMGQLPYSTPAPLGGLAQQLLSLGGGAQPQQFPFHPLLAAKLLQQGGLNNRTGSNLGQFGGQMASPRGQGDPPTPPQSPPLPGAQQK